MAVFDITYFSDALHRTASVSAVIPTEEMDPFTRLPMPDRDKPLRTMILLHGYSGCHTDWLRHSRIERLAMQHNIAILFPEGENSFYIDDVARDALYEQMICQEILELARRTFPLSNERKDTTIGGLSMGGYGALRNGLKNSSVFGNIIALSSALIMDQLAEGVEPKVLLPVASDCYLEDVLGEFGRIQGSDRDPKALAKAFVEKDGPATNIYMACGSEDSLIEANRSFSQYLDDIGIQHEFHVSPGDHDWEFWDNYIEKALVWLDRLN